MGWMRNSLVHFVLADHASVGGESSRVVPGAAE